VIIHPYIDSNRYHRRFLSQFDTQFLEQAKAVYRDPSQNRMSLLEIGKLYMAHIIDEDGEGWYRVRAKQLVDKRVSTTPVP